MDSDKENNEPSTPSLREECKQLANEYFFVNVAFEGHKEINEMKKKLKTQKEPKETAVNTNQIIECDDRFVPGKDESVGSVIKTEASFHREKYHSLDSNQKSIVSLGLNSILDLSFQYPKAQSTLFTNRQWSLLRSTYKPKKYDTTEYHPIAIILEPIFKAYKKSKSADENWQAIYTEAKKLAVKHDPEIDTREKDVSFCIQLILQILLTIKHQPELFNNELDSSEWDFIVKFWGLVTERLFYFSGLRLKWGDTHLTMHDTVKEMSLKVDLRILHDRIKQRFNVESEVGVAEAAEEDPGDIKYNSDRCKVLIESKGIVDRFLLDGCLIDNVDALQICGMEVFFVNLSLGDHGLYTGTQHYHTTVNGSLDSLERYMELAFNLLCFRDRCVEIYNTYESHLISLRSRQKSAKRCAPQVIDDTVSTKQTWIRGSWNPPRTAKTPPPAEPSNFYFKE